MSDTLLPKPVGLVLIARIPFHEDEIEKGDTGTEFRLNRTSALRYRYEYERRLGRLGGTEYPTLLAHFETHGGRRDSFLLLDEVDGVTRRVRFDDPELPLVRKGAHFSCSFELVTVPA